MRILLVTRNLPPLVGGMERLNWHMAEELSRYADVHVVGPVGSARAAPGRVSVTEVPLRPLWKFLTVTQWKVLSIARRWRPDIVLAGSGLTAPAAWFAAWSTDARSSVYVHGLDLAVMHPIYRAAWHPILLRMDRVIANSRPTMELAEAIGIQVDRIGIVHPGVQLPEESIGSRSEAEVRGKFGIGDGPLLLSVGRVSERKGLREFVSQSLPLVKSSHEDVTFAIVGDAPVDALHAKAQSCESIREAAERSGVGDNVRFLGTITDYDLLGSLYKSSNAHVFPVRKIARDPEGFGMVAIEAAAHGLPTVAFATGGVVDAVAEGESGCLVPPGDYPGFARALLRVIASGSNMRETSIAFAEQFAWRNFGERIVSELRLAFPKDYGQTP